MEIPGCTKAIRDKPLLAMKMAWGAQKEDRKSWVENGRKGVRFSEAQQFAMNDVALIKIKTLEKTDIDLT